MSRIKFKCFNTFVARFSNISAHSSVSLFIYRSWYYHSYFLIRFAQTKITLFIFWNNWVIKENESFLLVEPCSRVPKCRGNGRVSRLIFEAVTMARDYFRHIRILSNSTVWNRFVYLFICFVCKLNFLPLLKPLKMNSSDFSDSFERAS